MGVKGNCLREERCNILIHRKRSPFPYLGKATTRGDGVYDGKLSVAEEQMMISHTGVEHTRSRGVSFPQYFAKFFLNIRIFFKKFDSSCKKSIPRDCKAPCGEKIFDGFLRGGAQTSEDFSRHATQNYAKICRRRAYELDSRVANGLRAMVRALIADYNRAAGDDVLYYAECFGFWMLFQKQKDRCDKRAAEGLVTVEDLAALVERLQKEDVAV